MGSPTLLRRARLCLALAALTLLFAGAAPAAEDPTTGAPDDGAEPVLDVEFTRAATNAAERRAQRLERREQKRDARLRFRSRGRQFDLALDENRKLLDGLPAGARARLRARHELFVGELEGHDGSWVRLTRTRGRWHGLVFDGSELLVMEDDAARGPRLARLLDVPVAGSCGLEPGMAEAVSGQALVEELGELSEAGAPPMAFAASGRLDIAVVGDPAFVADHADPEGHALALLNAVDGIYAAQVGVSLRVVELQLLQSNAGLTSNDAGTLLTQLRNLTETGAVANPGLVHLLTGRSLDGSTVGVAYLNVLCNTRWGVGLSEDLSSFGSTVVLVAHEMGHNFGAPHDNQGGSACSSAPGGHIMSPWLDASADTFSACSLDQIAAEVAGASCIAAVEPPDPELPACSNGIDDDGDGQIDYGEDAHCASPEYRSEHPACSDNIDNDGDGLIDYPEDPYCRDPQQFSEADTACGLGFESAPFVLLWSALRRRRRRRPAASCPA